MIFGPSGKCPACLAWNNPNNLSCWVCGKWLATEKQTDEIFKEIKRREKEQKPPDPKKIGEL